MAENSKSIQFNSHQYNTNETYQSDVVVQDITSLEPLNHGGHAFVFKSPGSDASWLLKIFKFPVEPIDEVPPRNLDPYLYYNREATVYKRLADQNVEQQYAPKMICAVIMTAKHEAELFKSHIRAYRPDRYRGQLKLQQDQLPLKALLLEYVDGPRLSKDALQYNLPLQTELIEALRNLHSCGVAWGDVKWRNIIVRAAVHGVDRAKTGSLVILDFSNARMLGMSKSSGEKEINGFIFMDKQDLETIQRKERLTVKSMILNNRVKIDST